MHRIGLLRLAFGILLGIGVTVRIVPAAAQSTTEGRRIALVIGNSAYEHVERLKNPGNDARLIATTLRQLGFTLVGGVAQENLDKTQFDKAVEAFGRAIQGADVAVFYYAGHGLQVDGKNWLVPIDANPTRVQDLPFQMVSADLVLQQMNGAGTRLNLVILDACRNNPFTVLGTRGVEGGLAQMKAPEGTMIAFATQPGSVAFDGSGSDGPYALALAASMRQPGLDIFQTFNHVGLTVQHETHGAQVPWVSSSPIDGEFYFTPTGAASDVIAAATAATLSSTSSVKLSSARAETTTRPPTATKAAASAPAPVSAETPPAGSFQGLRTRAVQGQSDAQIALGLAYAKGEGVGRDDTLARQWFERAAAQGVAKAQFFMGVMTERGRGGPRSYTGALQWYRRAADQGYPPAEVAVARFYGRGLGIQRNVVLRNAWFRRAADQGNPVGEWALGIFYQFGNGVQRNLRLALMWYHRAADKGFVPAEVRLATIYLHGRAVERNYAAALHWFRKAARAGNPKALNSLGTFYKRGVLVARDYAKAMRLYRRAADKGYPMAEYNVGLLYAHGLGVAANRAQARVWFEKAAAAGNRPAIKLLARLDGRCFAGFRPGEPPRRYEVTRGYPAAGPCR